MKEKEQILRLRRLPEWKILEAYLSSNINSLNEELVSRFITAKGRDISDIIRGKVLAFTEVLKLDEVINNFEKMREAEINRVAQGKVDLNIMNDKEQGALL